AIHGAEGDGRDGHQSRAPGLYHPQRPCLAGVQGGEGQDAVDRRTRGVEPDQEPGRRRSLRALCLLQEKQRRLQPCLHPGRLPRYQYAGFRPGLYGQALRSWFPHGPGRVPLEKTPAAHGRALTPRVAHTCRAGDEPAISGASRAMERIMDLVELNRVANAMVAPGRGILAADESGGTIKKRFDAIGVESSEDTRRAHRDLLFTAAGAEEWISGFILYDETIRQSSADGTPFPKLLESKGIIPGIKVDKGAKPLALAPDQTITEGLDRLRERFEEYRELGARFAKWRAVYSIGDGRPSEYAVWTNAHALARSAALAAEGRLAPSLA